LAAALRPADPMIEDRRKLKRLLRPALEEDGVSESEGELVLFCGDEEPLPRLLLSKKGPRVLPLRLRLGLL
jgi:hypothetical protein